MVRGWVGVCSFFFNPVMGRMSDAIGRRPLMVGSCVAALQQHKMQTFGMCVDCDFCGQLFTRCGVHSVRIRWYRLFFLGLSYPLSCTELLQTVVLGVTLWLQIVLGTITSFTVSPSMYATYPLPPATNSC
jgi:hypothetical protein